MDGFISLDEEEVEPETEVDKYIREPVITNVNETDWWLHHANNYPELFRAFAKLCHVPASSASSERAFSTTGFIINDKRSRLLPENVNNIMVARNSI